MLYEFREIMSDSKLPSPDATIENGSSVPREIGQVLRKEQPFRQNLNHATSNIIVLSCYCNKLT